MVENPPRDDREAWLPPEPPGSRPDAGAAPAGAPLPPSPGSPGPPVYGAPGGVPAGAPAAYGEPGNAEATAALVLGIVSVTMVVLGFFLITLPIAVICGVIAIVLGRSGKRKVDRGETRRNRGHAQAGFVMGIVGTALGLLGVVGFILLIALSEEFQQGFEQGFEQQTGGVLLVGALVQAARLTVG